MAGCCNCLICGVITLRTVLVCLVASLGTGGCLGFYLSQSMALCCNLLSVGISTAAGEGLYALLGAGGCLGHCGCIAVTGCCDFLIGGVIALSTVLICLVASLSTGGCLGAYLIYGVACENDFLFNPSDFATLTGVGNCLNAVGIASRSLSYFLSRCDCSTNVATVGCHPVVTGIGGHYGCVIILIQDRTGDVRHRKYKRIHCGAFYGSSGSNFQS